MGKINVYSILHIGTSLGYNLKYMYLNCETINEASGKDDVTVNIITL